MYIAYLQDVRFLQDAMHQQDARLLQDVGVSAEGRLFTSRLFICKSMLAANVFTGRSDYSSCSSRRVCACWISAGLGTWDWECLRSSDRHEPCRCIASEEYATAQTVERLMLHAVQRVKICCRVSPPTSYDTSRRSSGKKGKHRDCVKAQIVIWSCLSSCKQCDCSRLDL